MAFTFRLGKACPGFKTVRLGAQASAVVALICGCCCIVSAILGMYFTYKENSAKKDRRNEVETGMLGCFYGAGLAVWGAWMMFTGVMLFGISVENKRALGFWLIYTLIIPVYYIAGLIFVLVKFAIPFTARISGWEIQYLIVQGVSILALLWIGLAVWVYLGEIKRRDKNPELRENEVMFAQPYSGIMPPDGTYNPGYGAPGGGSMSSIPRSQKSRHTYAPTEATESVRGGSTGRQSRFDQYKAQQQPEKVPMKSERPGSAEREGGTTHYRYEYNGDNKTSQSHHGSQGSLGGRPPQPDRHAPPQYQPAQYQPARYQRPQPPQPAQPSATQLYGSQGSLGGRQPYQPQHHASQGSIGGRQPYQPQHHASQGSLGGRQPQHYQIAEPSHNQDSEV